MPVPTQFDHLVYFARDLDEGIAEIEAKLGVAPVKGGSHPGFGTCNALLSLGDSAYLEILAPDPELAGKAQDRWLATIPEGRKLATWVMRSSDIEASRDKAQAAGAEIGKCMDGARKTPDGSLLQWRLSNPLAMPFEGCVPFLIDWGSSPHPSANTPRGGTLTDFVIEHPQAPVLRKVLAAMGEDVDVRDGASPAIKAVIEGKLGQITLE